MEPIRPKTRRRSGSMIRVAAILAIALSAACGGAPEVETVRVRRGPIRESFTEPARTRLDQVYSITMPVEGRIGRIDLEPGDRVKKGQQLVEFDRVPLREAVNEARAAVTELEAAIRTNRFDALEMTFLQETQATIQAAREALKAAEGEVEAQKARADRAARELERMQELAEEKTIAQSQLDDARLLAETSLIDLRSEQFTLAALRAIFTAIKLGPEYVREWLERKGLKREELSQRLAQARSRLVRAEHRLALARITSPIDGLVLRKFQESGGPMPAGKPLLEIGDPTHLEVIADVLTQDALRLHLGSPVELTAPDLEPTSGTVERIEPAGFTKVSSLGVEQQRVNVIVRLVGRPEPLGVGYHLQARFVTGSTDNTLLVPRQSLLERPGGSRVVYLVEQNRLQEQVVEVGLQADLSLEIIGGLEEGARIVAAPEADMATGQAIRPVPAR